MERWLLQKLRLVFRKVTCMHIFNGYLITSCASFIGICGAIGSPKDWPFPLERFEIAHMHIAHTNLHCHTIKEHNSSLQPAAKGRPASIVASISPVLCITLESLIFTCSKGDGKFKHASSRRRDRDNLELGSDSPLQQC